MDNVCICPPCKFPSYICPVFSMIVFSGFRFFTQKMDFSVVLHKSILLNSCSIAFSIFQMSAKHIAQKVLPSTNVYLNVLESHLSQLFSTQIVPSKPAKQINVKFSTKLNLFDRTQ